MSVGSGPLTGHSTASGVPENRLSGGTGDTKIYCSRDRAVLISCLVLRAISLANWSVSEFYSCGLFESLLDRPYTFIVLAVLILVLSPVMILRTPTDIFPNIDIPVIAVGWQYTGMNPEELEGRLTSQYERILTTTVDNIRTHRIDHAKWSSYREDLLATRREFGHRECPG